MVHQLNIVQNMNNNDAPIKKIFFILINLPSFPEFLFPEFLLFPEFYYVYFIFPDQGRAQLEKNVRNFNLKIRKRNPQVKNT